jgi:DNA polymerase
MVEATDIAQAADRMRTQIELARPQQLLLLGDRTARAFLPAAASGGLDHLPFFNHDGGTVPTLATFHPRLLLGQPAAKAECWRALQRLARKQQK